MSDSDFKIIESENINDDFLKSLSIKDFVREKSPQQKLFINDIEHQTF